MRIGDFSLMVTPGREGGSGHVTLPHNTVYSLRLYNHHTDRRADAAVTVDGKVVGKFRVDPRGSLTLERPADDTGRFTFFAADSAEGAAAGAAGTAGADRGVVSVRFEAEHPRPVSRPPYGVRGMAMNAVNFAAADYPAGGGPNDCLRSCTPGAEKTSGGIDLPGGARAGVTGLTGESAQRFTQVADLDYDPAAEVTVTLRLVAAPAAVRPLEPARPRSNPVPAPVE